jgi:hypothetical protein
MVDLRCINLFESSPLRRDRDDAAVLHANIGGRLIGLRIGQPHVVRHASLA